MSLKFDENDLSTFENHATSKKLPLGWLIMLIGLIAFGIYYMLAYSPQISGWTQAQAYEESLKE